MYAIRLYIQPMLIELKNIKRTTIKNLSFWNYNYLAVYLNFDAFPPDIVEDEFGPGLPDGVYSARQPNLHVGQRLSVLNVYFNYRA